MTPACLTFGRRALTAAEVARARVLNVGAFDVNGSFRTLVDPLGPAEYTAWTSSLVRASIRSAMRVHSWRHSAPSPLDVVISTEMLEHVADCGPSRGT